MVRWLASVEDGLFLRSRSMGPPWGGALRLLRYPAALLRDWLRGDISVRAMSLAYTTLLSIVPLLVFSFSILKGLGARADVRVILNQFFKPLGVASAQLTDSVMQFVSNMRADFLGSIGLAFLVYTVMTTIQKVESSFSFVWRVVRPRSFARRFTEYVSVLILGPILLAVTFGLMGGAEHSPLAHWIDAVPPLAWSFGIAGQVLPYVIVTAVFTFMYEFIPNTKVMFRAALIGGITSGIIWAVVGQLLTEFLVYSSSLVAVYTGFAVVLTTLIWVYLSWLILLIGAQLAFYLQFPQYLRHGQDAIDLSGRDDERVGLSIMYLVARDFATGQSAWTADKLAAALDIPSVAIAPVLHALEKGRLLLVTEREEYVPARDPAGIALYEVLTAVRSAVASRLSIAIRPVAPAVGILEQVEDAMRTSLHERTLKELVAPG